MTDNKIVESPVERLVLGMLPRLVAIDGPLSGRIFYLDEPTFSIGRLVSNNICLEDLYVSRQHCIIRAEGDEYMIEDLNSANGTYVNDERVNAGSLKEGSLIEIGASRFLFRLQYSEGAIASSQNLVVAENGCSQSEEIRLW
jgi:pSer/pThr/pTyr-binding forkhead associated (FHA) protein